MKTDVLVVGAGFADSVVAERLARADKQVRVIDKRAHVGGNVYDEHGVLIGRYGPHIFHANARRIVEYLSNFTQWRPYEHRALAYVDGKLLPIPINLDTVNKLYSMSLDEENVEAFFERVREKRSPVLTSEDVVVSTVGRQPVATINYPNEHDYIRVTEFKHLTGQEHPGTSVVREYPRDEGHPYYPIPRPENEALYKRYHFRSSDAQRPYLILC